MGQSEVKTYDQIKREYLVKELGTHISTLGNYVQEITGQAYDEGYRECAASTSKVLVYKNIETGETYTCIDGINYASEPLVEQQGPTDLPDTMIPKWQEHHFKNDTFVPTKIVINNKVYEVIHTN